MPTNSNAFAAMKFEFGFEDAMTKVIFNSLSRSKTGNNGDR